MSEDKNTDLWVPREGDYARRQFVGVDIQRFPVDEAQEERNTVVTINTSDIDMQGTVIDPAGGDLEAYRKNPVVLINHDINLLAAKSTIALKDNKLEANVDDDSWDISDPLISRWFEKLKRGLLNAASIGFTVKRIEQKRSSHLENKRRRGFIIKEWVLREWSFVSVPSNPNTLVTQRMLQDNPIDDRILLSLSDISTKLDNILVQNSETRKAVIQSDPADVSEPEIIAEPETEPEPESEPELELEPETMDSSSQGKRGLIANIQPTEKEYELFLREMIANIDNKIQVRLGKA